MSSSFGRLLKCSIFGESHGAGIGVVIDGLPAGLPLDLDKLAEFTRRRAPGHGKASTARKESDIPELLSGFHDGMTTGAPLAALIRNSDTHSSDYSEFASVARPGHADYTGFLRYGGCADVRGGGHFSARLTAPLTFAGGVALQLLEREGVTVGAHIFRVADIPDTPFDPVAPSPELMKTVSQRNFPTIDTDAGNRMLNAIEAARLSLDSVGGVVECAVVGFPRGVGSPMFDGLENVIASLLFGIPAVKGVEFGDGFGASELYGSENNDEFKIIDGEIMTKTNHAGGILGGISSGMPIILRVAFKPTPSIAREQQTVDFINRTEVSVNIKGRHDPCVVARAVPVVEAAVALALADALLESQGYEATRTRGREETQPF